MSKTKIIKSCNCSNFETILLVNEPPYHFIECSICGCMSIEAESEKMAIENWNYGKVEHSPNTMPERLRKTPIDEWKRLKEFTNY